MYNRAKKTQKQQHWDRYEDFAGSLKKELRQAHWQHLNKILLTAEEAKNTKPFWSYVRSQSQDNVGVSPLKLNGQLHSGAQDRANILSDLFKSVYTRDSDSATKNTKPSGHVYPTMASFNITEAGVRKLLHAINPSKAGDPDGIPCRMLKELADEIAPALTFIFSQSLSSDDVPLVWKK